MMNSLPNLFIIINDGFRWQEVFRGPDEKIINDPRFTPDVLGLQSLYWASSKEERRKKLLPFLWDVVSKQGHLFGDRDMNSKVNVANWYSISYAGYNEIFTGTTDIFITHNARKYNKNKNVLEWLQQKPAFRNKIAVFSSWDCFPFILNDKRNGLLINRGVEVIPEHKVKVEHREKIYQSEDTHQDALTFHCAMKYITQHHPRIVVIVFGEGDVVAHRKRYDLYLQKAHEADMMMSELWNFVQTTEGYKNNTNFLITTDHGRGNNEKNWHDHGFFINGSSQTWFALIGPQLHLIKDQISKKQFYNKEFASIIAKLLGDEFKSKNLFRDPIT